MLAGILAPNLLNESERFTTNQCQKKGSDGPNKVTLHVLKRVSPVAQW